MKLLQVPTANLEQRIKEELEVNPALEDASEREETLDFSDNDAGQDDNIELDDYIQRVMDDDSAAYKLRADHSSPDQEDKHIPVAVQQSFHDHLTNQLGLLRFQEEEDMAIALQIIGSIDDDGYLRRDLSAIMDDLMFTQNVFTDEKHIERILLKIQSFDPPGIGARDLQECLLLQLNAKLNAEERLPAAQRKRLKLAVTMLTEYFDAFTKKHYDKLIRQLDITEKELKGALDEILRLNPKPAGGYAGGGLLETAQYVIPDFFIYNREGELELEVNARNAPDLRISDQYLDMLRAYRSNARSSKKSQDRDAVLFIKQKLDSAKWFIDAIEQRQATMYNTMYTIMRFQQDFFLTGDMKRVRPMILKDVADVTGLDISTVSRVANSKFVQTEFGTYRLKEFFSESLSTTDDEDVSTTVVKNVLKDLLDEEDKRKPLSDDKLTELLHEKGYDIARRTVAKYREQLGVPVARLRREL